MHGPPDGLRLSTTVEWSYSAYSGETSVYISAIPPNADAIRIKLRGYETVDVPLTKTDEELRVTPRRK